MKGLGENYKRVMKKLEIEGGYMRQALRKDTEKQETIDEGIYNMSGKIADLVINAREARQIHPVVNNVLKQMTGHDVNGEEK